MLLLESRLPIDSITVMVQKEAAQRLCANVGSRESGAITVGVNYYGSVKQLFGVSRGSFMPSPNVDSAVIRIDIDKEHRLTEEAEKFFFRFQLSLLPRLWDISPKEKLVNIHSKNI